MTNGSDTAVLSLAHPAGWHSFRLIYSGMRKAYKRALPCARFYEVDMLRATAAKDLVKKLQKSGARRLVFYGHSVFQFTPLLCELRRIQSSIDDFVFHVDGSFSVNLAVWGGLLAPLEGRRVLILVASQAQRILVEKTLGHVFEFQISVCPLPVRSHSVSAKVRVANRSRLGCDQNDFLLTYVGRISEQKNIELLIDFLKRIRDRRFQASWKLLIAGTFDDHTSNHLPFKWMGEYFLQFRHWFSSLPEATQARVHFLDYQNAKQVADLLSAADVYVNLSTLHDEDFGLAPAEALCLGCPTILTAWGGFHDFKIDPQSVALVPVRANKKNLEIGYSTFQRTIIQRCKSRERAMERRRRANTFQARYSCVAVARLYKKIQARKILVTCRQKVNGDPSEYLNQIQPALCAHREVYFKAYQGYWRKKALPKKRPQKTKQVKCGLP